MWYIVNIGMKIIVAVIIEWDGPRCSMMGVSSMSMSGITESVRMSGMLILVFVACAVNLLRMYPEAKCPIANDLFSSFFVFRCGGGFLGLWCCLVWLFFVVVVGVMFKGLKVVVCFLVVGWLCEGFGFWWGGVYW